MKSLESRELLNAAPIEGTTEIPDASESSACVAGEISRLDASIATNFDLQPSTSGDVLANSDVALPASDSVSLDSPTSQDNSASNDSLQYAAADALPDAEVAVVNDATPSSEAVKQTISYTAAALRILRR